MDRKGMYASVSAHPELVSVKDLIGQVEDGRLVIPPIPASEALSGETMAEVFMLMDAGYPLPPMVAWKGADPQGEAHLIEGAMVLEGLVRYLASEGDAAMRATGQPGGHASDAEGIYWVLGGEGRYVAEVGEVPAEYLPVRSMLRTLDFIGFSRGLEETVGADSAPSLVTEGEEVSQRLLNYRAVVTYFRGDAGRVRELAAASERIGKDSRAVR
ncbi:hypothetical protein ACFY4C_41795 [Actinomadura viridis]|uniref:hypothetical protein n=1 Tax=Actinomadura viridis TaxID=58110 RepID=UPI00369FE2CB